MGTPSEHRSKAESHERLLEIIPDEFPDWLATVAFYAAVEWAEMMLSARGHHSRSHHDRKQAIKKHFPNQGFFRSFNDLYNASLDTRYLAADKCPTIHEVRTILIAQRLAHVRQYASSREAENT